MAQPPSSRSAEEHEHTLAQLNLWLHEPQPGAPEALLLARCPLCGSTGHLAIDPGMVTWEQDQLEAAHSEPPEES